MSERIAERFYAMLPQIYRHRDAAEGQPLRALLAVLEGEYHTLQADMLATYDNWFVDTCDQWVLPYLADLLGIRGLEHAQHLFPTQRRLVANALAYRRRKGTAAVLEHVLQDVTGWDIRVVEFAELLSITQHLAAPRPRAGRTVDLRDGLGLAQAGGAFERLGHTMDVRGNGGETGLPNLAQGRQQAKHFPANLGVFIWRVRAYPLDDVFACPVSAAPAGCFTFDAAGRSLPLFNRLQPVEDILQRAAAPALAVPLTRALLAQDLRSTAAQAQRDRSLRPLPCPEEGLDQPPPAANSTFYGPDRSFAISYRPAGAAEFHVVQPGELVVADLANWRAPLAGPGDGTASAAVVAVDPELGRLRFVGPQLPRDQGDVIVSYTYGFSADVGGGAYSRYQALQELASLPNHALRIGVAEGGLARLPAGDGEDGASGLENLDWSRPLGTLQAALAAWDLYCQECAGNGLRPVGAIVILDNGRYGGNASSGNAPGGDLVIRLPGGAQLSIIAGDGVRPSIRPFRRILITTALEQHGQHAPPPARASRTPPETPVLDRRLELDGLLVEGGTIECDDAGIEGFLDLELRHCTTLESGITVQLGAAPARALRVHVEHSIVGPLRLPATAAELVASDSIVDAGRADAAIAGSGPGEPGPVTTLERVTVLGATRVQELSLAADVIFAGPVKVEHPETGLLRRCYLPLAGSTTARREHCQPDLALQKVSSAAAGLADTVMLAALQAQVQHQVRPIFTSTDPAHPGFAQLHPSTAPEICEGGQAGAEMGAFHNLVQHQREVNMHRALDEYLPLGNQVSVHYVT